MSNKKSKQKRKAAVAAAEKAATSKKPRAIKIAVISSVSLLLVAAFVVGLVAVILMQKNLDYMKDDLSRYISISDKEYKNYELELKFDTVTEKDVDRKIMSLLFEHRSSEPLYNGANVKNKPVTVGDKVYIYYRGYTVDENGNQVSVSGTSNLLGDIYALEIGSLSFIPGFEEGLIGKVPTDYAQFELIDSGFVQKNDVIYLSYTALMPDGSTVQKSAERIDLMSANVDTLYGVGFKDYFEGTGSNSKKTVGSKISENATFALDGGTVVYFDMSVNYVTRCEHNAITVDAHFPADYQEASLRGTDIKFDVFIKYTNIYEVPEYDEKFITETLKISEETLSAYEGNSIVERHRSLVRAAVEIENQEARQSIIEEAVWDYYNSIVKVKRLPESDVNEIYQQYYNELYSTYQSYYTSSYSSFDAFARAYYGLSTSADWSAYVMKQAESVIIEKLIFYYIMRAENFVPSVDEFTASYNETVQEYLDYYLEEIYAEELEKIENEEDKNARILEIKEEMLDYYGEEYFNEIVYYDYALDKIIALAKIVEK